ncbi:acetate kinase [Ligilactobacillus salitolerans]|uniref:Acetate kinase n=1 Tax=Ligilactobacillus salitolerans TaxID=1808352 RepID=A0A401ISJ3_9LACO|nr:acetate kinase [Ligilactobacillus salitolerans]GBG94498.1 acetate kinase [Ligilactobacillus salitolerans]
MMEILAVNSGSSSFKFKLFEMPAENVIASGQIERIGLPGSIITVKHHAGEKFHHKENIKNHREAVQVLMDLLLELHIIKDYSEIEGVGHRVVAGGEYFDHSVIVDDKVIDQIRSISDLAPLHNPANLVGIEAFRKILPAATSVVVFDTAFHQTIPEENFIYSVPYEWYEKYGVRRYGAHGTSHRYVAGEAAKMLKRPLKELKLVSCHIGAGASICAIKNGESFDTSMGFTPLTGVSMATRSGDVDVSLVSYVMEKMGIDSISEMIYLLNKNSGLLGVSGISPDSRDVLQVAHTNHRAQLSLDIMVKDIVKYIGQYAFEMGGLDGIIFTAGVGENSDEIRAAVMERLAFLGITIDQEENLKRGVQDIVSGPDSKVTVMRIPTDEEVMIARDVLALNEVPQATNF